MSLALPQLMELIKFTEIDLELLNRYVTQEDCNEVRRKYEADWENSSYYNTLQNFETFLKITKESYPDVVYFARDHVSTERKKGVEILKDIFIKNGPNKSNLKLNVILNFTEGFSKNVESYIATLKKDPSISKEDVERLYKSLDHIIASIHGDPTFQYGWLRYYIDRSLGQELPSVFLEKYPHQPPSDKTKVTDPLEQGDDLKVIVEDEISTLRGTNNYQFSNWIENKKIILEATAEQYPYWIWRIGGLALAGAFLFNLYQGDAHTSTLVFLPLFSAALLLRARLNRTKNSFEYLVQMNIHRDGKKLDIFLQKGNSSITKIEDVPVREFKLHKGGNVFSLDAAGSDKFLLEEDKLQQLSSSHYRYFGVARDQYFATFGDKLVLVPFNYTGNTYALNHVFQGKEVHLAL